MIAWESINFKEEIIGQTQKHVSIIQLASCFDALKASSHTVETHHCGGMLVHLALRSGHANLVLATQP